jgi:histidyl-tRNA synthetase
MPVQPRTPPGVLELLPPQQLAFQRMLDTIRRGFERFGFLPVETPVFELTDVLLTKSGGETEKQVYFVQSTGALEKERARPAGEPAKPPELALRFDLTVPLARYVAEHEKELVFPFRRYQIQRVYRGERAQKGRYREFYQCDIDVIGKDTLPLAYDAEVPAVIHGIFGELAIGAFTIRINNRKLLRGLLESFGIAGERHAAVLHEVDRLGKQERGEIEARLANLGLERDAAVRLLDTLTAHAGDSRAILAMLRERTEGPPALAEGVAELERVYEGTLALGVPPAQLAIDLSIARGLDYYTGTVYETFLDEHPRLGSICSGGRYENLAGHYTKSKLPGVGISIGATRLFAQLLSIHGELAERARLGKASDAEQRALAEMALFRGSAAIAHVFVPVVEAHLSATYAALATELRGAGLNVEVFGGDDKLGKQLKYADRAKIPLVVILGERERAAGIVKLKDLIANAEHDVPRAELVTRIRALLGR